MPRQSKLVLKNDHLKALADLQKSAADKCGESAGATSGLKTSLWVSHGVISGYSNQAADDTQSSRRAAAEALSAAAVSLQQKLLGAIDIYQGVDGDLGANLHNQVNT